MGLCCICGLRHACICLGGDRWQRNAIGMAALARNLYTLVWLWLNQECVHIIKDVCICSLLPTLAWDVERMMGTGCCCCYCTSNGRAFTGDVIVLWFRMFSGCDSCSMSAACRKCQQRQPYHVFVHAWVTTVTCLGWQDCLGWMAFLQACSLPSCCCMPAPMLSTVQDGVCEHVAQNTLQVLVSGS